MKNILHRIADSSPNESSDELICRLRDCAHEIEALRGALAGQSAGAPTGYELVPIEPTHDMVLAGACHSQLTPALSEWAYRAMLSAAPAPVSEPEQPSQDEASLCERIIHAVEGECGGLAITEKQASNILAYLQYGAPLDDVRRDAERYRKLRSADINAVHKGGVFAGLTPENVVINGDDLDIAVDLLIDAAPAEQQNERGAQECPHGSVADGTCGWCYDENAALAANQCVHARGIVGDDGGTPCCPLTMTPDATVPTLSAERPCTCHPDDKLPKPCPKKYAYSECVASQPQAAEPKGLTEERPSFTNPLTPYGMLVRALRIVAGTTLYDMAKALLTTPAKLSSMEFGRIEVTPEFAFDIAAHFDALGIPGTQQAISASLSRAKEQK